MLRPYHQLVNCLISKYDDQHHLPLDYFRNIIQN